MDNPKVDIDKDTGEQVVFYNCPNCHYDAKLALMHSNAVCVPEGKLHLKGLPEGLVGQ